MALPVSFSDITSASKMVRDFFRSRRSGQIDAKVLETVANRSLWTTPRPFTGGGELAVRAGEIAEVLSLSPDVVADSFERMETEGKVRQQGGTLSNPAPYWTVATMVATMLVRRPVSAFVCRGAIADDNRQAAVGLSSK